MPAGSRNPRCSIPPGLQRKTLASFTLLALVGGTYGDSEL